MTREEIQTAKQSMEQYVLFMQAPGQTKQLNLIDYTSKLYQYSLKINRFQLAFEQPSVAFSLFQISSIKKLTEPPSLARLLRLSLC